MSESAAIPVWAQLAISIAGPAGTVFAFVFGRASKSGADQVKIESMQTEMASMRQTLNDTVVTVSNHGQSIRLTDGRIAELTGQVNKANEGIATLLERTKNM